VKQWNEMTTRERDALVAEKVMGWTRVRNMGDCDEFRKNDYWGFNGVYTDRIPHYTTDISAAWQAADKFHIVELQKFGARNIYRCFVYTDSNHNGAGVANTAPEAICKAVLTAVGVDVE
jgi:hypothetical protein